MRQSITPWPLSGLEENSRPLVAHVQERLGWFCSRPSEHARFLNTLSLMEHIGSRKIMTSQPSADLRGDTLKHVAEETRHAYFFKHAAEKLARRALDYATTDVIAGAAARAYMGRLDAAIACDLADEPPHTLAYLYMSLIVELRAVWFYRLYQDVLREHAGLLSLKSVLAEEELHLAAMLSRLTNTDSKSDSRIGRFLAFEATRFGVLWRAIEEECDAARLAAE